MKAFIVMPFRRELEPLHQAIKSACEQAGIESVRADDILQPGPIINQIFSAIAEADFIIAEVSTANPNVYYEIGLAHCVRKPSILLATEEAIGRLPFDIQHNRVIKYDVKNIQNVVPIIAKTLVILKSLAAPSPVDPGAAKFFQDLAGTQAEKEDPLRALMDELGKQFSLTGPELKEHRLLPNGNYLVIIEDVFGKKVTAEYDVNGIRRRAVAA